MGSPNFIIFNFNVVFEFFNFIFNFIVFNVNFNFFFNFDFAAASSLDDLVRSLLSGVICCWYGRF